jgi:hypothetical protein
MTDKELLELAAKAAGFGDPKTGRTCWTESEYPRNSKKYGALWNYVGHMDTAELWNPLTDDGDALRLAVKLRLIIDPVAETLDGTGPCAAVWCKPKRRYIMEPFGDDPYAATRRAITRAAAEIGKAMP